MHSPPTFGDLRALMNHPTHGTPHWSHQVATFIELAHQHLPELYRDVWMPYLKGFSQWHRFSLKQVSSLQDLSLWVERAPFALFHYAPNPKKPQDSIRDLVLSPHSTSLLAITLKRQALSHRETRLLAQASLPNLKYLSLSHNNIRASGISALCQSSAFPNLNFLDLSHNPLEDDGCRTVARALLTRPIHTLNLSGLQRGSYTPFFVTLEQNQLASLSIRSNQLSTKALRVLSHSSHLKSLHSLDLSSCELGLDSDKINTLTHAKSMPALSCLNLKNNDLDHLAIRHLIDAPFFNSLSTLNLSQNNIKDRSLGYLMRGVLDSSIHTLRLSDNPIEDQHAIIMAISPNLNALHTLELQRTLLQDGGIVFLLFALTNLRDLDVRHNRMSLETVQALANAEHLAPHVRTFWQRQLL